MFAGYRHSSGDAVIYMDADLQDPPELIPQLIEKWREGADVVYTVRSARLGKAPSKKLMAWLGYRVFRWVSDIDIPLDASDFRLMSRRVIEELLKIPEKDAYFRGLVPWVGFKQVPVTFVREPRFAGEACRPVFSKATVDHFLSGVTSFCVWPMHLCLPAGLLLGLASIAAIGVMLVQALLGWSCPDWWRLTVVMALFTGMQLTGIGILGVYLGRVYNQVRNRPDYIVESSLGFEDPAESVSGGESRPQ